jgi:hypothetical protein
MLFYGTCLIIVEVAICSYKNFTAADGCSRAKKQRAMSL